MSNIHRPSDQVKQAVLMHNRTSTNATPTSIDTLGYEDALISVIANTSGGSGSVDAVVQDSANDSSFSGTLTGSAIANIGDAKTATTIVDPSTINVKLSKHRRYLRVPVTIGGTASVTVLITLFNGRYKTPTWTIAPVSF